MDHTRWNPLNPKDLSWRDSDVFYVRLSKPGPRGGKRPPLWEGWVRHFPGCYSEAVKAAEKDFLRSTKAEVTCGP